MAGTAVGAGQVGGGAGGRGAGGGGAGGGGRAGGVVRDIGRVVEREALVYRRLWRSSLFGAFLSPVMFLAGIGLGLGGVVDERAGTVEGLSYLQFVTPGLLAGTAMQGGAMYSLWPIIMGMQWMRFFHGTVATPISAAGVFGGWITWVGLRIGLSSVVFLGAAAVFGGVPSPWAVLAVPAAVLTALAFAAPMIAFSAGQESDQSFPLIMRLVVTPLFLFSATFFPLSQLPSWLRPVSWVSPLWHGVELCRAATTGSVDSWGRIAVHTLVLVGVVAAGAALGQAAFRRRLTG